MEEFCTEPTRAASDRARDRELREQIELTSRNPLVSGLLTAVEGLLAILNDQRQIVGLNLAMLEELGIDDPTGILGLRLGEAVDCVHAHETEGGCGTSSHCPSCGAAVAIVTSLGLNQPTSRTCAIETERNGRRGDLFLSVHARPLELEQQRFLLLFLRDITEEQKWASLQRVFFHDLNNLLTSLLGVTEAQCEMIAEGESGPMADLIRQARTASVRISREVALQRCLSENRAEEYRPYLDETPLEEIREEIESLARNHPEAAGRTLHLEGGTTASLRIDRTVLMHVLDNMLINAFEGTPPGGAVKVTIVEAPNEITFLVWNEEPIPESIARRIFQRNVSTKAKLGRGIGTYSMRLFGEEFLGGEISFTTSLREGTTFRFRLPI